tara:strand:+ start:5012 stop:6778 length:1767 start_codon:yes stop_codon:yes gene_type:complete
MKCNDNPYLTSWTKQEHSLSIIEKLIIELTGYDGKISKEQSLSKDIGLESLDWIDFFIRLENYTRVKLSNKQLNKIFQVAISSPKKDNPDIEISLLSKLKVSHIQDFLDQQLYHPLKNENFNYSNWKESFFPTEQSYQPVFQTWESLANKLIKGDSYLKKKKIETDSKEMEILEFYWLHHDLGILVLEEAISNSTNQLRTSDSIQVTLASFLKDENLLHELRLQLARKCLNHADNALRRIDNTGNNWHWIIEDFIDNKLTLGDLELWLDFTLIKKPQDEDQQTHLFQLIRRKIIDFISERMHQILLIWESKSDHIEIHNETTNLNLIQQCHDYIDQQYAGFIDEFREIFHEETLYDPILGSITKKEIFEFQSRSNQFNIQINSQNTRFENLTVTLDQNYKTEPKSENLNSDKSITAFNLELNFLKNKWRSPLNFLIRFPQLGSIKERISLLMTTQNDWEKFLEKNIEKQSARLRVIFFACLLEESEWNRFLFENNFLRMVLNWQDLQLKLKKQDHKQLISRIEDVWAGIDLNIEGHDFPALEIFMRFGLKIFENDSPHKLFKWLSKPSDADLIHLTESNEIQSLSQLL